MQLTDDLRLAVPLRSDDAGVKIWGYHTPISREVFEANYRILAATKAALSSKGIMYQMDAGPQIATLILKDEGRKDAEERGMLDIHGEPTDGGASALLAEIKRLTMALVPGASGFEWVPIDSALRSGVLDADDWDEARSAILFFTCLYAICPKREKAKRAQAAAALLRGSITSSSPTEFAASLPTSTTAETSMAASSVPS
ncbi:MAG TPA: hypothetical protein PLK99_00030 [Burkholderiales bacterium]|nr:hypothetical protein [Burkholderiales bacterium]